MAVPKAQCGKPGCTRKVPITKIFCTIHWNKLSYELQSELAETYTSPPGLTSTGDNKFIEALHAAIDYLEGLKPAKND